MNTLTPPLLPQLALLGSALYLLLGMALIATCFNLLQEHMASRGGAPRGIASRRTHEPS